MPSFIPYTGLNKLGLGQVVGSLTQNVLVNKFLWKYPELTKTLKVDIG